MKATQAERFWSRVDRSAGPDVCWPWTGPTNSRTRYGQLRFDGRLTTSHRIAWELNSGRSIGPGMYVCHTCDNRPCCNPGHLYEGTPKQNTADMMARGRDNSHRTHCFAGHEYTPANTMAIPGTSHRRCLTCKRARAREATARYRAKRIERQESA